MTDTHEQLQRDARRPNRSGSPHRNGSPRTIRSVVRKGTHALLWFVLVAMMVSLVVQSSAFGLTSAEEGPTIERLGPDVTGHAPIPEIGVRPASADPVDDDDDAILSVVETFDGTADRSFPPVMTATSRIDDGDVLATDARERRTAEEAGLLENEARETIHEEVTRSPGISMSEVAERTGIPLSTVRYHTWVLTKEDAIDEAKIRGKRRLFPTMMDRERMELSAALEDDATARMLDSVHRNEPASVSELAESLDRSASTVSYHLQRLHDAGLVERERDGGATVTQLDPFVRAELAGSVEADGGAASGPSSED